MVSFTRPALIPYPAMTSITHIISEPNTGKVRRLWHAKKTSHTMQEIEKNHSVLCNSFTYFSHWLFWQEFKKKRKYNNYSMLLFVISKTHLMLFFLLFILLYTYVRNIFRTNQSLYFFIAYFKKNHSKKKNQKCICNCTDQPISTEPPTKTTSLSDRTMTVCIAKTHTHTHTSLITN